MSLQEYIDAKRERISKLEAFMQVAEILALRSTCQRRKVAAIVTDRDGLQILGIGFNGNARGLANKCDQPEEAGNCGCVHAELNALLKAPGTIHRKIVFTTCAPCVDCAKAILNSGVEQVFFRDLYRVRDGLKVLLAGGVKPTQLQHGGVLLEINTILLSTLDERRNTLGNLGIPGEALNDGAWR